MERGKDLLKQLEQILEHDGAIDEIGFVHPTQLKALYDDPGSGLPDSSTHTIQSEDEIMSTDTSVLQYDKTTFWYRNHKLAISTNVLTELHNAALQAYRDIDRKYKRMASLPVKIDSCDNVHATACDPLSEETIGCEVLKHSKALLILSCDFGSAWNSRKLVISRNQNDFLFLNELQLSELILSYSPKSDYAWTHRRWVIGMISGKCRDIEEIIGRESELVKKIAEKTKMNYRAWNHRGWLVSHMSRMQALGELSQTKRWAELHVADNSCFHYRRRLMLRILEGSFSLQQIEAHSDSLADHYLMWKEELKWDALLIEKYIGREALWMHRRFLLQLGLKHFVVNQLSLSRLESFHSEHTELVTLIGQEMKLLSSCLDISDDQFEDALIQAKHAASYLLWMWKHITKLENNALKEKLREMGDLQAIMSKYNPERAFLYEVSNDAFGET